MTQPAIPPPVLPYADLPARSGVAVDTGGDFVRVSVVTPGAWLRSPVWVAFSLAGAVGLFAKMAKGLPLPLRILSTLAPLLVFLVFVLVQWKQRIVLELTPLRFRVTILSFGHPFTFREWNRADVYGFKPSPGSDNLLLHVRGQDVVEIYIGSNPQVTDWVATRLEAASSELPPAADPAPLSPTAAGLRRGRLRERLFLLAGIGSFVALFILLHVPVEALKPVAILILLFSALLLGFAFGTQDRTHWFY